MNENVWKTNKSIKLHEKAFQQENLNLSSQYSNFHFSIHVSTQKTFKNVQGQEGAEKSSSDNHKKKSLACSNGMER